MGVFYKKENLQNSQETPVLENTLLKRRPCDKYFPVNLESIF